MKYAPLILLCLSVQSCAEGTYTPEDPQPILQTTLEYILPNTVWLERLGEPTPNFATQYRDNRPSEQTRTILRMDIGAGDTTFTDSGREWNLEGDTALLEFNTTPEGLAFDVIRYQINGYSHDTIFMTPILPGGSGTPRRLERQ